MTNPDAYPNALKALGYYDDPRASTPTHDPMLCAICGEPVTATDRLCRSLMVSGGRSYFFAYHPACSTPDMLDQIEWLVIDEIADADELAGHKMLGFGDQA